MIQLLRRLQSIDVFRAITMFFMIFVNDVDGVKNIPEWIKHVDEFTDGLGFADTVFPAFLFIVGLSIPFALDKRIRSDEKKSNIVVHIVLRSLALIVMGFFHVNLENYSKETALLPAPVWEILITLAFFLIWLDYKPSINKTKQYILQVMGIIILIVMAVMYEGKGSNGNVTWMRPHWWGILGLIGWAYLTCSLIYLFSKGNFKILFAAFVFFLVYTTLNQTDILKPLSGILRYCWLLNGGSEVSFVMAGILISLFYRRNMNGNSIKFFITMFIAGITITALGFLLRTFGGISKIHGTPSWVGICTGISILVFTILIYLIDIKAKANWFNSIKPAGTSTLTCYLIPYLLYAFMALFHYKYPVWLAEGTGGLLRSFAIAFIVVFIAGRLEKKHLRLKI
jgi:heparan-alpha-glucosaminide N-acetyltransferase